MEITIARKIRAEQWIEGGPLPAGTFECFPEVRWSASRELVYFTYAELRPRHWMGAEKLPVPEDLDRPRGLFEEGFCLFEPAQGEPYARRALDFTFWSVKSEASVLRDHRPVYVTGEDKELLALWHDYCSMSRFPNPIPRRIEYREFDSSYGRGFRPVYLKPGDWLCRETVPSGHDNLGSKDVVSVASAEDFERLRAAAQPE